ncbi:Nuclear transcription factor Y subunit C-4 [Capsicum annuum]|nr:Nuclear transcription factor Y subunit C-4 [Capsicum annuum]
MPGSYPSCGGKGRKGSYGMALLLFKGPSFPEMIDLVKTWISIVRPWNFQNPHQHYLQICKDRFICRNPCRVTRKFSSRFFLFVDLKRKHELPISRIRRAMKSNDQVKMVSAHSTVLLAKAIEMFILELTRRAWMQSEQEKRRTLKRCDIARAIRNEELFDFLSDIVPLQNYKVGLYIRISSIMSSQDELVVLSK